MSIGALGASIIRTVAPVVVGALLGWLATLGIVFDAETSAAIVNAVVLAVTALVTIVYYVVVRLIEQKFPQIGILLGLKKTPAIYTDAKVAGVKIETVEGRTQTVGSLVPAPDTERPGDEDLRHAEVERMLAARPPIDDVYSRAAYDEGKSDELNSYLAAKNEPQHRAEG